MDENKNVRRNYLLVSQKRDLMFEWLQEMLNNSFVLNLQSTYSDTFGFVENLIEEHRKTPEGSKSNLSKILPFIGKFHTNLPLRSAFEEYDRKYGITSRRFIRPSFNELRHIFNLAQVAAIGKNLKFISFDGDQTLYSDGGNFEVSGGRESLANALKELLLNNVRVAVVTAAGYGLDASKYEVRIGALLAYLHNCGLTKEQLNNFFLCGGECNYLLRCSLVADVVDGVENPEKLVPHLVPVLPSEWQAPELNGPRPSEWPLSDIQRLLDIAEGIMKECIERLRLRVRFIRKERAIGMFPGGEAMCKAYPTGHGSNKVKREALDEVVFTIKEGLQNASPPINLPYCVFNGGRDVWVDIGNKSIGVSTLQSFFNVKPEESLFVGDQFLDTGNDIAARSVCPCIWISNPSETCKILQHVLRHTGINEAATSSVYMNKDKEKTEHSPHNAKTVFDVYSGQTKVV